jgi:diguanylate cyclase (GGDEF)-like protein
MVVEATNWLDPVHSRPEFSALSCWALRRGVPHRPAGASIDVPCDHVERVGEAPLDTLCLPLIAQRETLGLLYLEPKDAEGDGLTGPEIYLDILAENIGLAVANLQLRETLREMALADPLTGLPNRRQLDQLLEVQLAHAERLGRDLGCLMVDVDHFKRFNDVHGHDAGDMILREVGRVLASSTREAGLAFRYGGEEFMVLLPGFSAEQANARAEEIRQRIAGLQLGSEAGNLGPVTVSIGVAITPLHCPPDRLVRTADAALLRAKAMGRDRVEMAQQRDSFAPG